MISDLKASRSHAEVILLQTDASGRGKWAVRDLGSVNGIGINGQMLYIDGASDTIMAKFSSWPRALDADLGDLHFAMARAFAAAARHVSRAEQRTR